MPCDTYRLPRQTFVERKTEIRKAIDRLEKRLASGAVKPVVGPQGAVSFKNWNEPDRSRVTDACAFRRIMAGNSAMAKLAIQRAETLAGRTVDKQVVAQGIHSHDGGATWHSKG